MDAQEEHDYRMSKFNPESLSGSRKKLEALLKEKNASSSGPSRPKQLGPIEQAMKRHRGLTREEAVKMAEAFGF